MAAAAAAIHVARKKAHAKDHDNGEEEVHSRPQRNMSVFSTGAGVSEGQGWRKYQRPVGLLYNHMYSQVFVAGLIGLNFLTNIVQAQVDPSGKKMPETFAPFELFFNLAFLIELAMNMYSVWFLKFWKSGWNIFDFFVVLIGWLFQLNAPLPGPMKLLRMMRAFRVFRLFKRVESLRKILSSLGRAIPGVMNAFLIQFIIICIFAIIAVDRFRDWGEDFTFKNEHGKTVPLRTARGQAYGFEYYGDFGKALYTMFQVLTGESWSEAVARPLFNTNVSTMSMGACFFFVLFSILNGVVLINVVVAVLLEKMVDPDEGNDGQGESEGDEEEKPETVEEKVSNTLRTVVDLKESAEDFGKVFGDMQRQLAAVSVIKEQVAALLADAGLEAEFRAAAIEASPLHLLQSTTTDEPPPMPALIKEVSSPESLPSATVEELGFSLPAAEC